VLPRPKHTKSRSHQLVPSPRCAAWPEPSSASLQFDSNTAPPKPIQRWSASDHARGCPFSIFRTLPVPSEVERLTSTVDRAVMPRKGVLELLLIKVMLPPLLLGTPARKPRFPAILQKRSDLR